MTVLNIDIRTLGPGGAPVPATHLDLVVRRVNVAVTDEYVLFPSEFTVPYRGAALTLELLPGDWIIADIPFTLPASPDPVNFHHILTTTPTTQENN